MYNLMGDVGQTDDTFDKPGAPKLPHDCHVSSSLQKSYVLCTQFIYSTLAKPIENPYRVFIHSSHSTIYHHKKVTTVHAQDNRIAQW